MKRTSTFERSSDFLSIRLMIAGFVLLVAAGCGTKRTSSDTTSLTPSTQSGTTTTTECSTATATIVAQNQPTGTVNIALGAEILWKVSATGCTGFKLVRPNNADVAFTADTYFNKAYSTAGTAIKEIVTVQALNAAGVVVKELQATSIGFNVSTSGNGSGSGLLNCQAVAAQTWINVPVNSAGQALQAPPVVNFTLTSNRPSKIIAATATIGSFAPTAGVPSTANLGIQAASGTVMGSGLNYIQFLLQDAEQSSQTALCSASVVLNPVVQGGNGSGSSVSCSLTPSVTSVVPGQPLRLTIGVSGSVASASIEGYSVNSGAPYINITATGTRTYTAQVVGTNGSSQTCNAQVFVGSLRVGVNFEDWTDNDYNDSVICMEGAFTIDGAKRIVSQASQVVLARATTLSACDHDVRIKVRDQFGNVTQQIDYRSSTRPSLQITFQPGWTLDTEFYPRGGCNMNRWVQTSENRVRVGNYCNTTGG